MNFTPLRNDLQLLAQKRQAEKAAAEQKKKELAV
jgi:hypothetical protein